MSAGASLLLTWAQLSACLLVSARAEQKIITADPGQNVTLTCRAPNNNIIVLEWSRADLESEYVLFYRDEQFDTDEQHPSFKDRVDLQDRQMKDGDVSMVLNDVTIDDEGTYECRVVWRLREPMTLLSIIYLRVAPPGPPGGLTEDGGKEERRKEDGFITVLLSLTGFAVFLVVLIVKRQLRNQGSYRVSV